MNEQWAKVELLGHRTRVGKVSEVEMFGGKLMRVAPIDNDGVDQPVEFYGAAAIYCLTHTTEAVVRAEVDRLKAAREEQRKRHEEWERRLALPAEEQLKADLGEDAPMFDDEVPL